MVLLSLVLLLCPCEDRKFARVFERLTLANGLVLDRSSDKDTVSCAATGMVAYSKALLVKRGFLDKRSVQLELRKGFRTTVSNNPKRNRGWLYHFTDASGKPKDYSEVSTVDTALFYLGFLRAAEALEDGKLKRMVKRRLAKIDIDFVMKKGQFRHGFYWQGDEPKFLDIIWDEYNEGVVLYRLFEQPFEPAVKSPALPLFVYYYPLCFYDEEQYKEMLHKAVEYQKKTYGTIGVTACDGPHGYQANDPAVVSPLACYAAAALSKQALAELKLLPHCHMVPAYSKDWVGKDELGIDFASTYIMTRLYQAK